MSCNLIAADEGEFGWYWIEGVLCTLTLSLATSLQLMRGTLDDSELSLRVLEFIFHPMIGPQVALIGAIYFGRHEACWYRRREHNSLRRAGTFWKPYPYHISGWFPTGIYRSMSTGSADSQLREVPLCTLTLRSCCFLYFPFTFVCCWNCPRQQCVL